MIKTITNRSTTIHYEAIWLSKVFVMTSLLFMVGSLTASAMIDDKKDSVSVKFLYRRSSTVFDIDYMDNRIQYEKLRNYLSTFSEDYVVKDVHIAGSASPEGSFAGNKQLAEKRAASLRMILEANYPDYFNDKVAWSVTQKDEDWNEVLQKVIDSDIRYKDTIVSIIRNVPQTTTNRKGLTIHTRKNRLMNLYGGKAWKELDAKIFPYIRGAKLDLIVNITTKPQPVTKPEPVKVETVEVEAEPEPVVEYYEWSQPLLAVKTNLLLYGFYLPQYGFAPIPNVAIEFYPRHGHWTVGASLDIPWWQNYYPKHKFFQIRNWQAEVRRYFRDDAEYTGWYAQAYLHGGVFGIGFSKNKGWEGEGIGGGIGGGYVLPITKNKHWKLEFNLQLGYMTCKYDPYVYGHPTDGQEDGLYYYDWQLKPEFFKKRQYRYNWLGPTRIGVTISYDLIRYKKQRYEKK